MISFVVVDDQKSDQIEIKKCLDFFGERITQEISAVYYDSGEKFIAEYKPVYDIVLMDIEMSGMSGLETAKKLREKDKSVILIFVTNIAQYALNGYEYSAFDYVVKPLNRYSFAMKLDRAYKVSESNVDKYVSVNSGRTRNIIKIPMRSIKYIDVCGHYCIYHALDGDFEEYNTLKNVMKKLDEKIFSMCNRFCAVNLRYVNSITGDYVYVGGEKILMSKAKIAAFEKALLAFCGGGVNSNA